jgi:hypothetical protein
MLLRPSHRRHSVASYFGVWRGAREDASPWWTVIERVMMPDGDGLPRPGVRKQVGRAAARSYRIRRRTANPTGNKCSVTQMAGVSPPGVFACREARATRIPFHGSERSKPRCGRQKERRPKGLRRIWSGALLLLGQRSRWIYSLVAPRPRPNWAQRNTSHLRDTTLGLDVTSPGRRVRVG